MSVAPVQRDVRDEDDLDALHAGWAPWFGQESTRAMFAAPSDIPSAMLVAEEGGRLVGYAHAVGGGVCDGHRGMGHVFVRPQHRGRGIGRALFEAVLEVCSADRVPGVQLTLDGDDAGTRRLAEAHGLVVRGLHLESELDLTDLERLRPLAGRSSAPDVTVAALPDEASDDDWQAFHGQFVRLMADAPDSAGGAEPIPYAVMRAALPESWQVMGAWRDGVMVGFTAVVVRNTAERRLNTMMTGIDRELRGHGVATCLKVTQAFALAEAGWRVLVTQNMEGNEAILAANRRMGFRPAGGYHNLTYDHPR